MKKWIFKSLGLLLPILFISACQSVKIAKILTAGTVVEQNFTKTIPFEYYRNWIVIEAKINNTPKTYRFMVDTGAPNVISKRLAQELEIQGVAEDKVGSSTAAVQQNEFAEIASIEIGGLHFQNTGAVIMDFNTSPDIKCLGIEVDGLIGSNLMRTAIWQIDYDKQTITITDNRNQLEHLDGNQLSFEPVTQGTPHFNLKLADSLTVKAVFDTGKTGGISLNHNYLKAVEQIQPVSKLTYYGEVASGIYGPRTDTAQMAQIPKIQIGDLLLDTMAIIFRKKDRGLVGNNFLKHFIVTIDWFQKQITLTKSPNYDLKSSYDTFGFSYTLKEGQAIVSYIFENSALEKANIAVGTPIKSINGIALDNVPLEQYCAYKNNKLLGEKVKNITVVLEVDGVEKTLDIQKADLFTIQ